MTFLSVSDRVLQRQHHLLGSNVTVERYNLLDLDTAATQSLDVSSIQDTPSQEFQLTTSDVDLLVIKCMERDTACLTEELKQLNLKLEIKSNVITVVSTKPASSESIEASKKSLVDLIHNHYTTNSTGIPDGSLPEMMELLQLLKEENLFDYKLSNKSTVLHAAGNRAVMDHFITRMKAIMDKHIQTQATHKLSVVEYEFTTQVILEELRAAFPNVAIELKSGGDTYDLQLAGSVLDLEAFGKHFTELKCHNCVVIPFPTPVIEYFNTQDGLSKLNEHIKRTSVRVGVHFCYIKGKQLQLQLLCKPSDLQLIQGMVKKLRSITAEIQVPLSESFLFIRNELTNFIATCTSLQSEKHVLIVPGEKSIVITGFKEDSEYCAKVLTDYVTEKGKLRVDVTLQDGVWKLFNSYMKGHWDALTSRSRELKVDITPNPDVMPPCVSLFGDRVNVNIIMDSLTQLKSTVQKSVIPVDRPGVCDLFTSDKGRLYMDGIEKRANVAIDVSVDGSEDAADSDTESLKVNLQTQCTASVNHAKLHVCIGDITEYAADVVVNAANEELEHIGGVALAIAQKGGMVIQADSTQQVRRYGKVDCGGSWLTTKTGNLPCKALVHAVGPKWNGGRQKEVALLYNACKTSLEKSCKYHSIVFPAISSGIYGFPIDLCADTMIKAAIDFSTRNPNSLLRKITFILHPKQAQQSVPFVNSLKKILPADKIYEPQVTSAPSLTHVNRKEAGSKSSAAVTDVVYGKVDLRQGGLLDVQV